MPEEGQFFNPVADVAAVAMKPEPGYVPGAGQVPSVQVETVPGGEENFFVFNPKVARRLLNGSGGEEYIPFF
jgi:hypothetical protein